MDRARYASALGPSASQDQHVDRGDHQDVGDDPAVQRLHALDLERAQGLGQPEQRHPQRLAPCRVPHQLPFGVADDVGVHLVLAEMLVVQQVILAKRHGARKGEREVAKHAQVVVVRLVAEHEVMRALVDQDVERVIDEGAEQIGRQHDPEPGQIMHQVSRQPLHGDQADDPQGRRRVGAQTAGGPRGVWPGSRGHADGAPDARPGM